MTNRTPHAINGVPGILSTGNYANGRARQSWTSEGRPYADYDRRGALIHAKIRFDNELGNAQSSFSVTASLSKARPDDNGAIGAAHDDVAKAFPELAHLNRWHMASTVEPWGYASNAVYHAGNRDHSGRLAGEPWGWHDAVRFGDVPALYRVKASLAKFLAEVATYDRAGQEFALIPVAVAGDAKTSGGSYSPKYQFAGEPVRKWYECAFDTEGEAEAFAHSVINHGVTVDRIPHLFSEGKARDLDAARRAAVWPDATDAQLCVEPAELRAALAERLPALMAEYRADIATAGLAWPQGAEWGER